MFDKRLVKTLGKIPDIKRSYIFTCKIKDEYDCAQCHPIPGAYKWRLGPNEILGAEHTINVLEVIKYIQESVTFMLILDKKECIRPWKSIKSHLKCCLGLEACAVTSECTLMALGLVLVSLVQPETSQVLDLVATKVVLASRGFETSHMDWFKK